MTKTILTIGGLDTWGGGGIGTDLKTIEAMDMFGLAVITCIATIGEVEPFVIQPIEVNLVKDQLETIARSYQLSAIKIGLLNTPEIVAVVKKFLQKQTCPIIIDPVLVFKESNSETVNYRHEILDLMSLATIVTPNLEEGLMLANQSLNNHDGLQTITQNLYKQIQVPILLKGGGRFSGDLALDVFYDGKSSQTFAKPKLMNKTIHGAGCGLATMLACQIAQGQPLNIACGNAKDYIYEGIVNHFPLSETTGNLWNRKCKN